MAPSRPPCTPTLLTPPPGCPTSPAQERVAPRRPTPGCPPPPVADAGMSCTLWVASAADPLPTHPPPGASASTRPIPAVDEPAVSRAVAACGVFAPPSKAVTWANGFGLTTLKRQICRAEAWRSSRAGRRKKERGLRASIRTFRGFRHRASCTATGNPRAISHGRHVAAAPRASWLKDCRQRPRCTLDSPVRTRSSRRPYRDAGSKLAAPSAQPRPTFGTRPARTRHTPSLRTPAETLKPWAHKLAAQSGGAATAAAFGMKGPRTHRAIGRCGYRGDFRHVGPRTRRTTGRCGYWGDLRGVGAGALAASGR